MQLVKIFENYHEIKPYQCGKCKIWFSIHKELEEHVAIHERKKLIECMNPDKRFAQQPTWFCVVHPNFSRSDFY